jgi:LPPG:FO 2-phospho-L-lactate transferase
MGELGVTPGATAVAAHYAGLIDGLIVDVVDAAEAEAVERLGIAAHVAQTVMRGDEDRIALAREALDFAAALAAPQTAKAG